MSEEVLIDTFTTMRKKLLSIAARFLPNEDEADDALQDAFCRLWAHREKINTSEEAELLTRTTLRNMSIDNHRRKRIETVPIDEQHDRQEEYNSNEREAMFHEVETIIENELTPLQRDILRSKEYNGEKTENIAERLGMQTATVRMQLSRARKKIRECYNRRNEE